MPAVIIPVDFFHGRPLTQSREQRLECLRQEIAELEHIKILAQAEMTACADRGGVLLQNFKMIDAALRNANNALNHFLETQGGFDA